MVRNSTYYFNLTIDPITGALFYLSGVSSDEATFTFDINGNCTSTPVPDWLSYASGLVSVDLDKFYEFYSTAAFLRGLPTGMRYTSLPTSTHIVLSPGCSVESVATLVPYLVSSTSDVQTVIDTYNAENPTALFPITLPSSASDIQTIINNYNTANPTALFSVSAPLPSLNGNGCEYLDGDTVTVIGRDTVYAVKRSYMGLVADNSYTALYDLQATDGAKCSAPENLLVRYVAPVVTTP